MINNYNNISSCQTYERCGFYMESSFNQTTTKFCTIFGNKASSNNCVYPHSEDFSIYNCNFVNNSVSDYVISSYRNGVINSCVILNNTGKNIFVSRDSYYIISVIHCFCDRKEKSGNVNIDSIDTKPFINDLKHFSSYLCQATKLNLGFEIKQEIVSNIPANFFRFLHCQAMMCS